MASQIDENVKVCVRVRPMNSKERQSGSIPCLAVHEKKSIIMGDKEPKIFSFDYIADQNTTQEEVFVVAGKPITETCISGYNGTIFAYGQTGSGKTFTILGSDNPIQSNEAIDSSRGLIPRILDYLFCLISREERNSGGRVSFLCKSSCLEIYNETITDLLNPASHGLHIREDIKQGVYVENLKQEIVSNAQEAVQILKEASKNRTVAATSMNSESSRSHSVFTLYIQSKELRNGINCMKYSRLNLIDLAGSERQKNTDASGQRLKEAGSINRSLSALGNVIRSLVDVATGLSRHVHYRDSKLTFLLKDSLGGNSKTTIIATVSPSDAYFGETLSTLKFAQRAKLVHNKAFVNEDSTANVAILQAEVKRLKQELVKASMLQTVEPVFDRRLSFLPAPQATTAAVEAPAEANTNNRALLYATLDRLKQIEKASKQLEKKVETFQGLVESKDKLIQSKSLMLRLRDARIAKLEAGYEFPYFEEIEALREEIRLLNEQIKNNPDLIKFAMENLELREIIEDFETLYGNDMAGIHEKMKQITDYNTKLTEEIQQLIAENRDLQQKAKSNGVLTQAEIEDILDEFQRLKESSSKEISALKQKEIELESDVKALRESMFETEETITSLKQSKDREIAKLVESHRLDIEQIKIAHENELSKLRESFGEQNTIEFEKQKEETDIRILHLDTRINEMTEERTHFLRQIEAYKDEARKLRYELSKKEIQNSRLSEVFIGRNAVPDSRRFSELPRLSMDFDNVRSSNKFEANDFDSLRIQQDLEAKDAELQKLKSEYNTFKEETETLLETSQYQSDLLSKKIEEQATKLKEMEDLEKKLTSMNEVIANRDHVIQNQDKLLLSLQDKDTALDELMSQNSRIRSEYETVVVERNSMQEKYEYTKLESEKKDEQIQDLTIQLQETKRNIEDIKEALITSHQLLREKESQIEKITSEIQSAKIDADEANQELQNQVSCTVQLEKQLETLQVERLESEREYIQQAQSEISQLREQISQLEDSKTKEIESTNQIWKDKLESLQKSSLEEISKIKEDHKIAMETLSTTFTLQMNERIGDMEKNLGPSHAEFYELQQKLELQNVSLKEYERKQAELTEQYESTVQELKELQQIHENTVKSLEEYSEALHTSQLENLSLKETHEKDLEDRELIEKQIETLQERVVEQWSQITQLTEEMKVLNDEKAETARQLETVRESEVRTFNECLEYKSQISRYEEENDRLSKENAKLNKQNNKLLGHSNPKQKIQLHIKIKEENNQLKKEIQISTDKLTHKEMLLKKVESDLEKARKNELDLITALRKYEGSAADKRIKRDENKENEVHINLNPLNNTVH